MDWFLYDNGFRHERVKPVTKLLAYYSGDIKMPNITQFY